MRRYGARPASCEYRDSRVWFATVWICCCGLFKNALRVFQTSPELASMRPQLPLTIWLLFYFYLVSLFNPTISNCLGAMIFFFLTRRLISNFTNTAAGQKLEESESMFEAHSVFSPQMLICSFWNFWFKQMCVKSSAGAVEKKLFWLMYNLQQLYLKAPASHTVPLLLPPPLQSLPENVDFSSFWKK